MRERKPWREALTVLTLAIGAALLMGPTWPRDDSGTPAAQCSFIGSAGSPTLCSTTDPLPTAGTGTQSTTDPTGWGRTWLLSSGLTAGTNYAVFTPDGLTMYAVERQAVGCPTGNLRTFLSTNAGRTFALADTSANTGSTSLNGAARTSAGVYTAVANNCPGVTNLQILVSGTGFQFLLATRPTSGSCSAGFPCDMNAIASQGNTVIAIGPGARCRSTNGGTNFSSCVATIPLSDERLSIASATTNIWIASNSGDNNIYRSTDDGLTWTSVLALGADRGNVTCLSPTICLATGGTTIWRSTNSGATWTAVKGEPFGDGFDALLNFGNGVAVAWVGTGDRVYRTADFGATWNFQVTGPNIDTGQVTGDYLGGSTLNGRGLMGGTGVAYSPIVGAGETIVAGQSGARWNIDGTGRGAVLSTLGQLAGDSGRTCSEPAANTAATVTVTGVAGQKVLVGGFIAYYTAAPAAAQTVTITSGGANIWLDIVTAAANTPTSRSFGYPLQGADGTTVVATLPAGGAGVSGKLCLTAAQFTVNP